MRWMFMLLVLANAGFFAWQHWYAPDRSGVMGEGEIDTRPSKGLQLVGEPAPSSGEAVAETAQLPTETPIAEETIPSEVEQQDNSLAEVPGDVADEAGSASVCATIGPFDQLEMAQVAAERLRAMGSPGELREAGGQIRSGFWVYLPPYPSRDEAKQIEDELRARNVRDLFIVTGSEQQNAISLGLFSTPERADQRAAEIGRLGYTPRVAERFRDATVYWVDFREFAESPLEPERIGVMGAGDTLPEKHNIPCRNVAEDDGGA